MKIAQMAGWYGVLTILAAYSLNSFQLVKADSAIYQLLNLTGSAGIVASALTKKDYQPAVLNIVWACIAIIALLRTITG